MNTSDLKAIVLMWGQKIGRERAISRLILTGKVAVSTAEQLVDGRYLYTPKGKVKAALETELLKDGFKITRTAS